MNSEGGLGAYMDDKVPFMEPRVEQHGSSMVMTGVYKPTKIKYLNIDTRFSNHIWTKKSLSSTEITFNLPERVKDVKSIKVKSIEIPMTFYNISSRLKNNSLQVMNNTTSVLYVITIPDGYYSSSTDLISAINVSLAPFNGLSLSLSGNNSTITHDTSSSSVSFTFEFYINTADPMRTQQLGWILGFRQPSIVISTMNTVTSDTFISMNIMKYMYLVVDEFSNNIQSSFLSTLPNSVMNKKILARIELDSSRYPFGSVLVGNETHFLASDCRAYNGKATLQKLNLQLVNEWGLGIDCNGMDYSFLLEMEYE